MRLRDLLPKPDDTVLEQHIAVFGESGSGKTVLMSSFYGAMQEPAFMNESLYHLTADDPGQGNWLFSSYVGMKNSARRPEPTRFSGKAYRFSMTLNDTNTAGDRSRFHTMRLVWHDYPGEWFEQDVSGQVEARRRADTFRSLLGSDVAILLIDGQRMLDNAGEEERYLKSVLTSFRTGLKRLKSELLPDGAPLVRFPRIWIVALSKADLLPDLDVFRFRELVIGRANEDLEQLRQLLASFVESPEGLAVGEDFLLLSSAKFEPNAIEVTERIGLDLVMPLAAVLPLERHVRWADQKRIVGNVFADLLGRATPLAASLAAKSKYIGPKGFMLGWISERSVRASAGFGVDQLRKLNADARARRDFMAAILTRFGLDLEEGEAQRVLLRSRR